MPGRRTWHEIMPSLEKRTDEELVRMAQRELPYRADAFTVLMRRYESQLIRFCVRFLRTQEEAEDICQETMLRVFHALPSFEQRASFKTWLYRIAHNLCVTRHRALSKDAALQRELEDGATIDHAHGAVAGPHETRDLLSQLPDPEREILLLRHELGMSFEEIAEALQISLSAAKMRVYRAAENLRVIAGGDGS